MKESDMQTAFGKFIRGRLPERSAVFELKICKKSSISFGVVKEHQRKALLEASVTGLFHKITDTPWGTTNKFRFTQPKPFDCVYLRGIEAYVVIWFYHERQPKKFIFIPIRKFIEEEEISSRKSLTEDRAKQIGTEVLIDTKKATL